MQFAPIIYSLTLRFIRSIHKSFGYNIFFMAYNCYPNIFLFWPKWKSEVIFSKLRLSVSVLPEITSRNEMIRKQNEKKNSLLKTYRSYTIFPKERSIENCSSIIKAILLLLFVITTVYDSLHTFLEMRKSNPK